MLNLPRNLIRCASFTRFPDKIYEKIRDKSRTEYYTELIRNFRRPYKHTTTISRIFMNFGAILKFLFAWSVFKASQMKRSIHISRSCNTAPNFLKRQEIVLMLESKIILSTVYFSIYDGFFDTFAGESYAAHDTLC